MHFHTRLCRAIFKCFFVLYGGKPNPCGANRYAFVALSIDHSSTTALQIDFSCYFCLLRMSRSALITGWNDFQPREGVQFHVEQIPKHATGICQPLDVYVFRMWKEFTRKITQFVIVYDIEINLHDRDNIIKLQSLIHNQFQAPRFNAWLNFAWRKAGYFGDEPFPNFQHPVKYCFELSADIDNCQKNCGNIFLLRCAYCEMHLCFEHFFADYHLCENA